mgnify:CR=1 FL=1
MIDTDRYEGHTEGPWNVIEKANDYQTTDVVVGKTIVASNVSPSDSALIADAPLILEDYKRLREAIEETVYSWRDKPWGVMGHTIAIALRNAGEDILNILYGGEEE